MLLKERHKFLEPNLKRNCGFSVSAFLQINTPNLSKNGILAKHLTVGLNMRKAEWNLMTCDLQEEVRLDYLMVPSDLSHNESMNKSMKMLWLTTSLEKKSIFFLHLRQGGFSSVLRVNFCWPKLPGKPWRLWCLVQVRLFSRVDFTLASCVAYLCWQLPEFWQLLVITLIMTPFPLFKPWLGLHILLPLSVSHSLVSIRLWKQASK